ncbi:MAG TPA: Na+/H+ antiporter subunit E [Pseudonocardiaceae bacterium]|nr:Na+/H+ antiporter subunit E [Pseudonocardiaceae bacterium]
MRAAVEIVVWWVLLALVWVATLTAVSVQELVTASVLAAPCAVAARAARIAADAHWRVRPRWLRRLALLPVAALRDTVGVLRLAVHPEEQDTFEHVPLPAESDEPGRAGREALTTAVLTATPGVMVVDAEHDRLLVYTLPLRENRRGSELRR